ISMSSSFSAHYPLPIFFFFNATSPTHIYTLSLYDALPISRLLGLAAVGIEDAQPEVRTGRRHLQQDAVGADAPVAVADALDGIRSEEHTSELQSRFDLVCRLQLEKKKNTQTQ